MLNCCKKRIFFSTHTCGHPGACKRMHGHNWVVEAKVEGEQSTK